MVEILGLASAKTKNICKDICNRTMKYLDIENLDLTIKFVGKREIQRLNKEFRQIDRVTDVLSFPATNTRAGEPFDASLGNYLGDMALCLSKAKQQSKDFGTTYYQEVQKLIVHSILHLMGYDHISDQDYEIMQAKEQEIEKFLDGRQ